MSPRNATDKQVTKDNDELTFRMDPIVVPSDPPVVRPPTAGSQSAPAEAVEAAEDPAQDQSVVPSDQAEGTSRKEAMKVVKLRVPASMHVQIVALMSSFGCVSESQAYRHVLYVGLKHTKRSR